MCVRESAAIHFPRFERADAAKRYGHAQLIKLSTWFINLRMLILVRSARALKSLDTRDQPHESARAPLSAPQGLHNYNLCLCMICCTKCADSESDWKDCHRCSFTLDTGYQRIKIFEIPYKVQWTKCIYMEETGWLIRFV